MLIRRTWLLSDEEREAAELKGELKGKRDLLTQVIGLRFPEATPEFIKRILSPNSDAYLTELTSVVATSNSFEEFQSRALALAPDH